ncbi:MAG TPA: gamma-glutamyltransferase, partial [Terrimicrobium sp.]
GDAFVMVFWRGKLHGLNASGRAGRAMTAEALRKAGWVQMPQAGWGSVSVPGAADGYFALHERFGSKRFADLVEPAACYAEEGVAVSQKVANSGDGARRNYDSRKSRWNNISLAGSHQNLVRSFDSRT